ncbi:MAG: NADH-quinone oxidoreductase subunit J [Candidatus Tectomicrobia bacterium]|nr:NADH-quinone oxidoreductase subunit J [Candidatus Tectomicrobia bacterium]
MTFVFFYLISAVAVGSALLVIFQRNQVYSAFSLILSLMALCGLYFLLYAQFIAVIQIVIYAGAVMVLFIFVIMLLNVQEESRREYRIIPRGVVAGGISLFVLLLASWLLSRSQFLGRGFQSRSQLPTPDFGSAEKIGELLFTTYLFPFEVTSILLLVAIVGAILLARRRGV